jgi:hypothetical protein
LAKLALHALGQKERYYEIKAGRKSARRRRARSVDAVADPLPRDPGIDAAAFGADGLAAAMLPQAWGAGASGLHPAATYGQHHAPFLAPDGLAQAHAGMQRVGRQAGRVEHRLGALAPLLPVPPAPPSEAALVATCTPLLIDALVQPLPQQPLGAAMVRSPSINSGGSPSSGGLSGLTGLAVQMTGLMALGSDSDEAARRRASEDSVGRPMLPPLGRRPLPPLPQQHPAADASTDALQQSLLGPAVLTGGVALTAPYVQPPQPAPVALAEARFVAAETRRRALHADAQVAQLKSELMELQLLAANGVVPMPGYAPMELTAAATAPPLSPPLLAQPLDVMQRQQALALAAAAQLAAMHPERMQAVSAARTVEETARVAAIAAARSGAYWPGQPPPSPAMQ